MDAFSLCVIFVLVAAIGVLIYENHNSDTERRELEKQNAALVGELQWRRYGQAVDDWRG